jgi:hypothetical protein
MSVEPIVEFYRDTAWAQTLLLEGREGGLQEGREQGREGLLLVILRVRFGDRPELSAVASRLATWAEADAVSAIEAANGATELLEAEPPSRAVVAVMAPDQVGEVLKAQPSSWG